MITVRSLHIYPVKSCRGISVDNSVVVPTGFRFDRQWMVVTTDQENGSRSSEPLRTLAGYRTIEGKVCFGQNLVHHGTGKLQVGDEIHIRHLP